MPIRIAFDQQVFLLQQYGGISRYVSSLAKELSKLPDTQARIVAPLHFNHHLSAFPDEVTWGVRMPRIPKTARLVCAASEYLSRQIIKKFQPQIVHETYYSNTTVAPKTSRRVITVYDMIHERFASMFNDSAATTAAKRVATLRADHVLCISESTRRDLLQLFNLPEHKVSVVHIGYDLLLPDNATVEPAMTKAMPYLLYVGSRGAYKNFEGLLRAVASADILKNNLAIVCFGGGAWTKREVTLINELGLSLEKIRQIEGGDSLLAGLYQAAEAFIYPSLYEGFGIPPLEAMFLGCPVICSNTSSLPEVVGDAGEYFDPANIESMRFAIENVMQSRVRRDELVQKGRGRCTVFSWARCAQETLSVYRSLV